MKSITVLLVDPDAMFREALEGLLKREPDVTVIGQAGTGAEAIQQAPALRPDVVILELSLPDKGGVEVIRFLRFHLPRTRVIALTHPPRGSFHHVQRPQALEAGAFRYLPKGVSFQTTLRAIRAAGQE
ncbi:MAG: response regulator transcription factor [Dehalococcoidia bacterium]